MHFTVLLERLEPFDNDFRWLQRISVTAQLESAFTKKTDEHKVKRLPFVVVLQIKVAFCIR